ncbi:MAG: amino acid adenylation domain-containing protein [Blastocatellales bacterium]
MQSKVAKVEGFRLSPQQKLLWQAPHGGQAYLAQCALLLEGDLNIKALKEALRKVIARHEIFRTTFRRLPGMKLPVQVVSNKSAPIWRSRDLSKLDSRRQAAKIEELFLAERGNPFDFEQGPLVRATLLALSAERHALLITLPSLCADARTLRNLADEIGQFYASSFDEGEAPDNAVQYVQFSEWQNSLLEREDAEAGREYWRKQNLSAPPVLKFPYEVAPSETSRFEPESLNFAIDPEVVNRLEAAAHKFEATTEVFLLACWQTLLWRLTGEQEVLTGHISDGREHEMLHGAFGLFAKWLPVKSHFADDASFGEILSQANEALRDGYEWQEYFSWPEELGLAADNAIAPIGFEFTELPEPRRAANLIISTYKQSSVIQRFKLLMSCLRVDDSLNVTLHYDSARYEREEIERVAGHFTALAASAASNPDALASELDLLGADDRRRLLIEFNQTAADYPYDQCIHQLFERQAARNPHRVAVVCAGRRLTYAELNSQSNQLARHLRGRGVGAGSRVGLCVDRSVEMIVGILAILKAGAAYVPLNAEYPRARLAAQLEESAAPVALTQAALIEKLPEFAGEALCLDRDCELWAAEPEADLECVTKPEDAVYVIYTSGSTGTPKGVVVRHRGLVNYAHYICGRLKLDAAENADGLRFATVSTITADLGNTCVYPSLISGGCLHVMSYETATDGALMASYVSENPIDVLKIVPSHLNALLASQPAGMSILPRKYLILGGEALSRELVERIAAQAASCKVINHYGPTETTVGSLTADVIGQGKWRTATNPIGRPIANTEVYILDRHMKPAPIGVAGELYIGGAGLAEGYLNQAERTAERFVKNPYSDNADARLYKTGDLTRYLPDGQVEFLGRTDNQVKIRGYRVELEEIEAALGEHPSVRQAVVVAREEEAGHKRLVAYVVPNTGPALSINDLHSYLNDKLPEYMTPSAYVTLDTLPLTANGKVDRKALPAPDYLQSGQAQSSAYVAARTPAEELMAETWANVLGVERVGIHDNFFSLGGHSLLAMKLIARMREVFRKELPLRDLFERPTVAQLAATMATITKPGLEIPPITPVPRDQELPLSFSQQRLWFLDQLEPGSSFYNVPAPARLTGKLDVAALRQAISEVIRRHEVLRTVYRTVDGRPVQVVSNSFSFTLPVVDLRGLPENEREAAVSRLATEDGLRSFDLAEGPLFRAALLQLSDEDQALLSTTHHIISDVWSKGVLIREVAALYQAFADGRPSPLPELPVQYADFAYWQRRWLRGEVLDEQLSYWKRQLAGSPSVLELPTDHPRPAVQSFRGADLAMAFPEGLSKSVVDLSRREGVTLFMTMLAAYQALLFRYTGQESVNVGSPIAGRARPETEGMIGFFLNTLVFKADFSGDPSFRELLRQVRGTSLEAYAHQDLPFEQLVEALQPERNMSHSPLFQAALVTMNRPMETLAETLEIPGLKIRPLKAEGNTAKYDLTLFVVEGRDGLTANVEYSADLFDASTITRMTEHFFTLLEGMIANPDQRVSSLPLMTETETKRLLVEWNDTTVEYQAGQTLPALFEAQVERTPEAVALVFEDAQLTYRELNHRANQLAHHLRRMGVGPESLVGVCMERSLEMMVGILGVLKAGGAYAPLDPAYPMERLAFMLEDSEAPVLLTQWRLVEGLRIADRGSRIGDAGTSSEIRNPQSAIHNRVVCLDAIGDALAVESVENPDRELDADHPAYVIYTSGSTGQPKGVIISHGAICNHMLWQLEHLSVTANDRILQKTAFSFDASGTEFYLPLLAGARLVLARPGGHQDSGFLVRMMVEHQVTILQLVPSLLRVLLDEPGFERCESLRRVICAGEALPAELQQRFAACLKAELHNLYGPTEAAIDVTCWPRQDSRGLAIVPIGRPIANTQIYLLSADLRPAPVGVPGELYIGGVNLARGYLNRPELTAERFVPNPFSNESGARLYRTGDLARYMPDGAIEFLGRGDHQVKLRGMRIELGEIEAALSQHPAVREAVVVAREDVAGDKRLVAYLVNNQHPAPTAGELRAFLKERLPEYMAPTAFVTLGAMPLTPNGKVDRRALPKPDKARPDLESAFVAPRNSVEETLAEIAAQLLRIEKPGIHDNFFELGGHSLLATQLISRVRNAFQVELPLRSVFTAPTIAELAEAIEKAMESGGAPRAPEMKAIPRETRRVKAATISKGS